MNPFRKMVLAGLLSVLMVPVTIGVAHASYYDNTFTVEAWTGTTGTGPGQVTANASIGSMPSQSPLATFTYTGPIDFVNNNSSSGSNTYGNWFGSHASGISNFNSTDSLSQFLGTTMSTGNFGISSYLSITGNYGGSGGTVTVNHDDGASLYTVANNTFTPVFSSPGPTSQIATSGFLSGPNTFDLIYVEANGAPAVLTMSVTPEPGTWILFATGVAGLLFFGLGTRRSRTAVSQI
ncbi:MAG: PEP-CTERM sorting domain-containing protein [Leptospirillum sp.]